MAPIEQLLDKLTVPVAVPATVGSNSTSRIAACPGLRVTGNAAPGSEKPVPLTPAELMVTTPVPEEVIVTDCVAAVFRSTLPKAILDALSVRVGVVAFSVSAKIFEIPPAVAVSVTV
jgi:hypothetical protein